MIDFSLGTLGLVTLVYNFGCKYWKLISKCPFRNDQGHGSEEKHNDSFMEPFQTQLEKRYGATSDFRLSIGERQLGFRLDGGRDEPRGLGPNEVVITIL